ncbi:hypothetical protein CD30_17725 [Ureibacillus massiliensis 4400831 = CIP 108448 = CCUG 49529]|uniref:Abi family protein n=1 Tax=Ureibacillus massiliensis 4400831 = CIP 108448 = CCUG 49529 TaxID=1211035 RepID=A0A0A3IWG7_9BACL|nr:Abi family protein [Ureibacillus massiliensis]KGR89051.1 hypothetical protein CD30_17725 [Ureibacillus massiliensis 4400831 = CIP 108448 = CCUG 49529]
MSNRNHVTKEFLTIDEQIELLKNRKLIIKNEEAAKIHLLEKNYFDLINGFETLMLKDSKAATKEFDYYYFEDFIFLYEFDKKLNVEILRLLDRFETRFKTSMAHRFCEKHFVNPSDARSYIDVNKYTDPRSNHLSVPREIAKPVQYHKIFNTNISFNRNTYPDFIEFCKAKYTYLSTYADPPFWMTIKVLEFGVLFQLLIRYERDIFVNVIADMGMNYLEKQKFINSIRIFIELRNTCAHFQLVNRFRTPNNLRIDAGLIVDLGLKTKLNINGVPTYYEIRLYDVLLVLSQFENLKDIRDLIKKYYFDVANSKRQRTLMTKLFDRMGRKNISDWIKLGR